MPPTATAAAEASQFPKTTKLGGQLARVVPALPAAVVVRVHHVDVVRARVAVVAHLEGDAAEVPRLPGLGLRDAHELREHVGAGGVGEDGRGRVAAEGDRLDVDAHPFLFFGGGGQYGRWGLSPDVCLDGRGEWWWDLCVGKHCLLPPPFPFFPFAHSVLSSRTTRLVLWSWESRDQDSGRE